MCVCVGGGYKPATQKNLHNMGQNFNTKNIHVLFLLDEFCKLKDEVTTCVLEAHVKGVRDNAERTGTINPNFGLEKTCIAGAEHNQEETRNMGMNLAHTLYCRSKNIFSCI